MESFGIATSSMLVELSIGCWTARKLDRKVSNQVDVDSGAKTRAGNYQKNLLAGTQKLENIVKFAANARAWHQVNTLPWSDNGLRLLPMENFIRYKERLGDIEEEFDSLVQDFLDDYPNLVSAAAFQLGNLFDRSEYPEVDQIADKFRFNYMFSPVPIAGDFRIDINEQAKAELEEQFKQNFDARLQNAMKNAWSRLHDCLTHVSERLEDNESGANKLFRNSLVENAQELVDLLKVLNVTKDPDLERARQELAQTFVGLDADDLRKDPDTRKGVRLEVQNILSKFNF
jgi:uncharacterized membrane-anchored protein YhcB (DUF1043 family)